MPIECDNRDYCRRCRLAIFLTENGWEEQDGDSGCYGNRHGDGLGPHTPSHELNLNVVIEVQNGCAEIVQKSAGVTVTIRDLDCDGEGFTAEAGEEI